jgi:ABC-2 type transport system permease protein
MTKVLAIAKSEFTATVTRKGYAFAVIALPLVLLAVPAISYQANKARAKEQRVAVVDDTGLLGGAEAAQLSEQYRESGSDLGALQQGGFAAIVAHSTEVEALRELESGAVDAVYVLPRDYRASGRVTVYTRQKGMALSVSTPAEGQVRHLLRAKLAGEQLSGQQLARVLVPMTLQEYRITAEGQKQLITSDLQKMASFLGPLVTFILFSLAIFLSANYLLQGTAEEKQNKVIEALLSAASPSDVLAGKLLGLGGAALLQMAVYVLLLFVPAMVFVGMAGLTVQKLLLSAIFFGLGFVLFASIMAAIGMVANSVQEGSQMSILWTAVSVLPLLLFQPLSASPDAVWARVMSVFPLTAPVTMLLRIVVSSVPTVDLVASAVALLAGIVVSLWGGAKIFRTASLMTGKRATVPEILRWLKEA